MNLVYVASSCSSLNRSHAASAAAALGLAGRSSWHDDAPSAAETTQTASARRSAGPEPARAATRAATTAGAAGGGSLVFSASSGELVMTATGLAPLEAGAEYGCWVEVDGERRRLGRMYWAGNLWAWAGPADGLADLPAGTAFGVSLVAAGGGDGQPVLAGEL